MIDPIISALIKKIVGETYDYLKEVVKKRKNKLHTSKDDIEESLNWLMRDIVNWSDDIEIDESNKSRNVTSTYILLDLYLLPIRLHRNSSSDKSKISLFNIFKQKTTDNIVIVGQPGTGKTTSMKYVCKKLLTDPSFFKGRFNFPIVVRLRDLKEDETIFTFLYKIFGLRIEFYEHDDDNYRNWILEKCLISLLDDLNPLLILDGFDEVNVSKQKLLINELREFALKSKKFKYILTSRSGDFHYQINKTQVFEIAPLTDNQILAFSEKWLRNKRAAYNLFNQIKNSPYKDTTVRPLTLAHLCIIFERQNGKIPDKPKTVYSKIVNLLLEEWDQQRSIEHESKYANFEIDQKFKFLANLSYHLSFKFQKSIFTDDELLDIYKLICENFGLPLTQARTVINELETHNGLILEAGYRSFSFAHKSIQEFLAAEHLTKLPSIPENQNILLRGPNELAICIALASNSSEMFAHIVLNRINNQIIEEKFLLPFLERITVEKPDFEPSKVLAVTFLFIYTTVITTHYISQAELTECDRILDEFFEWAKLKKSIERLTENYEFEDRQDYQNYKLSLFESIITEIEYEIPQQLYCKREYFDY
ncbi:MAG: NACHT domain-containing protein [bacterium]|nr:NACHT domain-containing protein [bacterium]